jgi:hypothetical protein
MSASLPVSDEMDRERWWRDARLKRAGVVDLHGNDEQRSSDNSRSGLENILCATVSAWADGGNGVFQT